MTVKPAVTAKTRNESLSSRRSCLQHSNRIKMTPPATRNQHGNKRTSPSMGHRSDCPLPVIHRGCRQRAGSASLPGPGNWFRNPSQAGTSEEGLENEADYPASSRRLPGSRQAAFPLPRYTRRRQALRTGSRKESEGVPHGEASETKSEEEQLRPGSSSRLLRATPSTTIGGPL